MTSELKANNFLHEILVYPRAIKPDVCRLLHSADYMRESVIENVSSDDNYAFAKKFVLKENEKTVWLKRKLMRYVETANNDYYNFHVSHHSDLQLIEYKEGCFFDWHIDIAGNSEFNSKRKINTVIFLSDQNDYEGGQLTFDLTKNPDKPVINQEQGTLILFPSYLAHKVNKVTRGVRYSLSTIFMGNCFH